MTKSFRSILFSVAFLIATSSHLHAQGTAFTYQGRLDSAGNPANGAFDLRFTIYAVNTNGAPVSVMLTNLDVAVTNGLFTETLDFGAGPFTGVPEWLEVDVRTNGAGSFTTLWPRQLLTAAPYAIMAGSASNLVGALPATQLSGAISQGQLPATVITNTQSGVNLAGSFGGSFSGTLANASINYAYKSFNTNYTVMSTDTVLDCTGTNQIITLLPSADYPPTTLLTIWSDNVNGSVIVTNGTGFEAITVPGQGQALAVVLGPANSPSNSVTLMVHGGHW